MEAEEDKTRREGPGQRVKGSSRLERGALVGRYVVLDVLGEGGMGIVYSAWDPELDRRVAIKLLQARRMDGSQGDPQAKLLREAQALARLSHPNVVSVHDVGALLPDRVFVAMELVEGANLRAWVKEAPRDWRTVQRVMLGAGAGLAAAHAAGLVHRDFKPDNVLIGKDGRTRVTDFGLARLAGDDTSRDSDRSIETKSPLTTPLTVEGSVAGTPAYMAPELHAGVAADARSDQFSFGVTLYEALYRKRPYESKDLQAANTTGTKPRPPPDLGVPAAFERIVMRAMSLDPTARFASMDDLLAELAIDPRARRRRILLGAGIAVVAAGAIGAATFAGGRAKLCTGAERRLAGVWDAARKGQVKDAFAGTGRASALRAFEGVSKVIDAYAAEWSGAVVESCQATRIRGEQTEEVLTLRNACFDQRLEELRAFTQILATADEQIVDKAGNAALGLEPIRKCANIAALRAPQQPPPEQHAQVTQILSKLADAKAGLLTGKLGKAINQATAAAEAAAKLPAEFIEAEARLVLGMALLYINNPPDAEVALAESAWAGLRSRRDDVAANAAFMAATLTSGTNRTGEAKLWLALGAAAAKRTGFDRPLELRRLEVEGIVLGNAGELSAAVAAHAKALELSIQMLGKDSNFVANDEQLLAATMVKNSQFAEALPHYERALTLLEQYLGPEHADVAVIITGMASCYAATNQPDKARAAFERGLAIQEKIFGADSPNLVANLNNSAEALRDENQPALGLQLIERAQTITEKSLGKAHPYWHNVATTKAELLTLAARVDEAKKLFDEVLFIEERTHSTYLGYTLMARGKLALFEGKAADAVKYAEQSIAAYGNDAPELWRPLQLLGQAQLALGRKADAKASLTRALALGEAAHVRAKLLAPARAALQEAQ